MREGLMAEIRARAKKEKKSEHAVWVDILYDKKYRATNAGGKVVSPYNSMLSGLWLRAGTRTRQ